MNAPFAAPGVQIHCDFDQGSDRWLQARCGMLTASEFDRILTPKTLAIADNPTMRAHLWEMAAQRITRYVEPQYIGDAMLRGQEDEILARELYSEKVAPVQQCGFVTNNKWGFTLGCSPDGLVGADGLIEAKSHCQKIHLRMVCEYFKTGKVPDEHRLQVHGVMLVAERKWCDLILRCGGLPQVTIRVFPDEQVQSAIIDAAAKFESRINETIAMWQAALAANPTWHPTERRIEQEMIL